MDAHKNYLKKALEAAKIREGFCAPNPPVGCVIVKDDQIIAEGYHFAAGQPHAEVVALSKAGEAAKNAIAYVTLEPCSHHGRTPPCTDKLISSNVSKVFYGFRDPNPQVYGKGEQALRDAGIGCEHIPMENIDDFYQAYAYWHQTGKPFITAKLAMSADHKIAGEKGARVQITGPECERFTHEQRKRSDAILTTVNTVNVDDPKMNVRLGDHVYTKRVYVIDREARLSPDAILFKTAKEVVVFHGDDAPVERLEVLKTLGAECVLIPFLCHPPRRRRIEQLFKFLDSRLRGNDVEGRGNDPSECRHDKKLKHLDFNEITQDIGKRGDYRIWCEAGGCLFTSLVDNALIQKAYLYVSPKWLGENAYGVNIVPEKICRQYKQYQLGNDTVFELDLIE
ncbi:MAG: bifunctional diaminohydroxyphosphoribosylaminopyrimidine deaminase/5-amino-6-(5-phosphoribosylamino)uracil reductase RibD [Gammaproteobacteria bacterium]